MAADSDLTLAATLATELGVDPADAKLPRYIAVASEAIRQYLNRRQLHYSAAYVEKVPGFLGSPRLVLGLTPLRAIASIVLPDGSTVDASEYVVEDADAGLVYRDTGWTFTGLVQAGLLYQDPIQGSEKPSIVATYAGGWVTPYQATQGGSPPTRTLPYDIEEAAIQTAVGLYRRGGTDGLIAAESLGEYSVTFRSPVGGLIPEGMLPLLDKYRRPLG